MKYRFDYRHIALALLVALIPVGLSYLPYLAVRNKTIETFRVQQSLLAQQAGNGLQGYVATYEKALTYLAQQQAIQILDAEGQALLQDFLAIRPQDINAIQRIDATGVSLFAIPEEWMDDYGAKEHCRQIQDTLNPAISDLITLPGGGKRVYFSAPVYRGEHFDGCISFALPFSQMASRHLEQIPLHHDTSILLFNHGGKILAASDTTLVGRNIQQLQGEADELIQLQAAIAADKQNILTISRQVTANNGSTGEKVYAVISPVVLSGDIHWSMVLLTPVKDVMGAMEEFRAQWLIVTSIAAALVGLLGMILSSIVTRQREVHCLRTEKDHLAGLLDLAPMGVFLVDHHSTILYANRDAYRMICPDGNPLLGRSFVDFLHQDSRAQVVDSIAQPSNGQGIQGEVVQLVDCNATVRDVVITAAPYRMGTLSQCLLLVRDVTEERRSAARQRRLIEAVDQVKEAMLIADCTGKIDYLNAALGKMVGYKQEECLGQPVRMLCAKEQHIYFEQKIKKVVEQGKTWQGRIVNQRKDGGLFVAAVTVSPMRGPDGDVAHFILVQRDITHDMKIESRMRQAQKMEAIGTLAGGIAHDFNNILGGIIGFTDLALLHSTPGTGVHDNLLHIRQGGKRAADLVQQILTFSRQSAMEKVPVPMAALIKESLNLMRATLPTTIEIRQELLAADAAVMATPVQIQQIIINLCTNAFYAMREKGGCLTIRLERTTGQGQRWQQDTGDDRVMLVVEDTGHGIESDILPNIFMPFFSTKQAGEGTGMGLSVVHGIVHELGGEISVQSRPNQGSVFTVLLPKADRIQDAHLVSSEEPLPVGSEHILVVDDEKEIRETCRMMLAHLGYTVTTTGNPQEVLTLIEQAQPPVDLVLTDQTMPKMTGLHLITEIRRLRPEIPIILCTGYSDRLNHVTARDAGACDLLMKPMDLRGLSSAVRSALDGRQSSVSI
jgi:PAS domain S-box